MNSASGEGTEAVGSRLDNAAAAAAVVVAEGNDGILYVDLQSVVGDAQREHGGFVAGADVSVKTTIGSV